MYIQTHKVDVVHLHSERVLMYDGKIVGSNSALLNIVKVHNYSVNSMLPKASTQHVQITEAQSVCSYL
jgi:hypothetical protein